METRVRVLARECVLKEVVEELLVTASAVREGIEEVRLESEGKKDADTDVAKVGVSETL